MSSRPDPPPVPAWGCRAAAVLAVSEPDQVIVVQDRDQRDRVLAAAAVLGLDRQVEILPVRPERLPPVPREYRDRIRRGNSRG